MPAARAVKATDAPPFDRWTLTPPTRPLGRCRASRGRMRLAHGVVAIIHRRPSLRFSRYLL